MVKVMGTVMVMVIVMVMRNVMVIGEQMDLELTVRCSCVVGLGVAPISTCQERLALPMAFAHRHLACLGIACRGECERWGWGRG